ncbi:MAG: hypothetical protein AABY44_02020 [Nitrospirota bacterium]
MVGNDKTTNELRCECGSLIAVLTEDGVEIKCRRCKRIKIIPLATGKGVVGLKQKCLGSRV